MRRSKSMTSHWVFAVTRLIGATPFDANGKISRFSKMYFILTTLTVSFLPFFMLTLATVLPRVEFPEDVPSDDDPFTGFKMIIGLLVQLSLMATSYEQISLCFRKGPGLNHILSSLTVESSRDLRPFKWFFLSLAFYFFTGFVELYCAFSPGKCKQLYRYALPAFGALCLNFYNSIYVLQFSMVLTTLNGRLKFLTEIIILHKKVYSQGFYRFLGVAKEMNLLYRKQMFYILVQIVLNGVAHAYYLLHGILFGNMLHDIPELVYNLNIVILKGLSLFLITADPQEFKNRAESFYNELFKLMRENTHLCKDNKLLLYVTVRQSVNFTACGFFNLGYPLVTSIITAVTTYLVILIQFSIPPSKN